ncbi:MAG: hypothetical protein QXK71_03820 [Pyrobaculum sp.]|jgi:heme/copper-type cytochrome/quinol oxidase subunit 2
MSRKKLKGLTTVEALLIAAAFIIVGVIGVLTFQGIGKSAAESVRANAIVTADRGGFDVTIEVLNGRVTGVYMRVGPTGEQTTMLLTGGGCITSTDTNALPNRLNLVAGQSATCRFNYAMEMGRQYTYVVYAVDSSGKAVQIAKGVVTVGLS